MVMYDFHGLKTINFHSVADIAYFGLAVTEKIQLLGSLIVLVVYV